MASARVTISKLTGAQMVSYGESMQVVTREKHALGDLVRIGA